MDVLNKPIYRLWKDPGAFETDYDKMLREVWKQMLTDYKERLTIKSQAPIEG